MATPRRMGLEAPRQLEDRRGARGVVVGAVADGVALVERVRRGAAEVVEVRADDDDLPSGERAIPTGHHGHDVLGRDPLRLAGVGELGAAGRELLEEGHAARPVDVRAGPRAVAGSIGQRPSARVAPGKPAGGAVVAGGPRGATLEPIVSQIGDVAPDAIRGVAGGRGATVHGAAGGQQDGREQHGTEGDVGAGGGQGRQRHAHRSAGSDSES